VGGGLGERRRRRRPRRRRRWHGDGDFHDDDDDDDEDEDDDDDDYSQVDKTKIIWDRRVIVFFKFTVFTKQSDRIVYYPDYRKWRWIPEGYKDWQG
jgi:hypothetical protein